MEEGITSMCRFNVISDTCDAGALLSENDILLMNTTGLGMTKVCLCITYTEESGHQGQSGLRHPLQLDLFIFSHEYQGLNELLLVNLLLLMFCIGSSLNLSECCQLLCNSVRL